jgi:hypothetical protein
LYHSVWRQRLLRQDRGGAAVVGRSPNPGYSSNLRGVSLVVGCRWLVVGPLDGSWESWFAFRPYGAGWLASRPVHHNTPTTDEGRRTNDQWLRCIGTLVFRLPSSVGPQEVQRESLHHRGTDRPLEKGEALGRAGDRPGAAGIARAAATAARAGPPASRSARRAACGALGALGGTTDD